VLCFLKNKRSGFSAKVTGLKRSTEFLQAQIELAGSRLLPFQRNIKRGGFIPLV